MYTINYKDNEKYCSQIIDKEQFMSIREFAERIVTACREGDKESKKRLPQINYTGHYTDGQLLKGCKMMSDWCVMDINDKAEAERVAGLMMGREEELGIGMVEKSVNHGLHIVCRRGKGEGIEDAQKRLSDALGGITYNTAVHDVTRVIFCTGISDLLYLSDSLFADDEHPEEISACTQQKSPADNCQTTDSSKVYQTEYK